MTEDCIQFQNHLNRFLAGELTAAEREVSESHVKQCAACAKIFQETAETLDALSHLQSFAPSSQTLANIRHAAKQAAGQEELRIVKWFSVGFPRIAFAGVVAAAMIAVAYFVLRSSTPPDSPPILISQRPVAIEDNFWQEARLLESEIRRAVQGQSTDFLASVGPIDWSTKQLSRDIEQTRLSGSQP